MKPLLVTPAISFKLAICSVFLRVLGAFENQYDHAVRTLLCTVCWLKFMKNEVTWLVCAIFFIRSMLCDFFEWCAAASCCSVSPPLIHCHCWPSLLSIATQMVLLNCHWRLILLLSFVHVSLAEVGPWVSADVVYRKGEVLEFQREFWRQGIREKVMLVCRVLTLLMFVVHC